MRDIIGELDAAGNLMAYYNYALGHANDLSRNKNHPSVINDINFIRGGVIANSTAGYIRIPHNSTLNPAEDGSCTILLVVTTPKVPDTLAYYPIFKGAAGSRTYAPYFTSTNVFWYVNAGGVSVAHANRQQGMQQFCYAWSKPTGTSACKLYENGVYKTAYAPTTIVARPDDLWIVNGYTATAPYRGIVHSVVLINKELIETEHMDIYRQIIANINSAENNRHMNTVFGGTSIVHYKPSSVLKPARVAEQPLTSTSNFRVGVGGSADVRLGNFVDTTTNENYTSFVTTVNPTLASLNNSYFHCSGTEAAYGTWIYSGIRSTGGSGLIFIASQNYDYDVAGQYGYFVGIDNTGSLLFGRTDNGVFTNIYASAAGLIANNAFYRIKVTRTAGNVFSIYLNGTLITSATDATYTTSKYLLVLHDIGEKIIISSTTPENCLQKYKDVI